MLYTKRIAHENNATVNQNTSLPLSHIMGQIMPQSAGVKKE